MGASAALSCKTTAAPAVGVGRSRRVGANEKVTLGLIGCGGRGRHVMSIFQRFPDVEIAAVCDVYRPNCEKARGMTGGKATTYNDYRQLLERSDIDAVIVATNGHWHVLPTIHACEAGKDVYVEKPLGTSIGEGRAAVKAARRCDRIVHHGTQQRSMPHYARAVEIIRSGKLGDISRVGVWDLENQWPGFGNPPDGDPPAGLDWDFWLGPAPPVPFNINRVHHHYWFFDYGGAWQLDWAVHHYDIVHWAMGVERPYAATAMGGKLAFDDNREWPDTFEAICEYPPGPASKRGFLLVYTFRGGCQRPIEQRFHGKAFYGTDATLVLNRNGYEIYSETREGKKVVEEIRRGGSPEDGPHQRAFIEAVRSHERTTADIETAHYSSNPGHLMNIAWRVQQRIRWDAEKEQVVGDREANQLVTRKYRKPWALPT
ncbi:MAG: hypothetical protein AMJ72_11250 [Acidithiobacillales bacterium SM1_46]|nr:MAG: hypothetical protein AMJ72_11250 [Acidithiobacillales bacterium SM1_46]